MEFASSAKQQDEFSRDRFDHVVNALWDGRLALNEALGFRANRLGSIALNTE